MAISTLKILREINDFTQEFIAEDILYISQATYARLEINPSKLTAEQAQKLAALYKVNVEHLLSESLPVVVFKDSTDIHHNMLHTQLETTLHALQIQNELLIQQNTELVKLIKVLSSKTADLSYE
ncbi:MAG TPA: helix-turn-helix transcriptional regulator [Parafilimonas sp.]|nr:helix-turn-helix transcriptional regulator [Parafilimonas sp.]